MAPPAQSDSSTVVLWGDLAADTVRCLSEAGVPDAAVQARRLVEQASGYEYHTGLSQPAPQRGVAYLDAMRNRLLDGVPLQYVLGCWGFRGLDLMVSEAVLIPRPETEVLAGWAITELVQRDPPGGMVIDLGTGSGAVGLAVAAECTAAQVVLTDVSTDALAVARANLAGLGRAATRVSICQGSWYEALSDALMGTVDVIVSNPPYVRDDEPLPPEVAKWEPALALRGGSDGLDGTRKILADAARWLSPGGAVLLELGPDQLEIAADLARSSGLNPEAIHPDLAGRDRVLQCRLP